MLVEGLERATIDEYTGREEFFEARATIMPVTDEDGEEATSPPQEPRWLFSLLKKEEEEGEGEESEHTGVKERK